LTDEAQAIAEVARTTGEAIRAAGGLGAYLNRVFGSIPDNLLGLGVGDWLEHKRRRHLAELEANTKRYVEQVSDSRITEPSPSVLIPLLKNAIDEGRPELQDLWAALLANAMLDGGQKVRRDYFEAIANMEPTDARVFEILARHLSQSDIDIEIQKHSISQNDYLISIDKLHRLNCINQIYQPAALTPFGHGLLAACKVI
jgi:hypothetical protein